MTKLAEKIIDLSTGEERIREYTVEEMQEVQTNLAAMNAQLAIIQAEAAAKETARKAVLEKLGLTSEEVETLLP